MAADVSGDGHADALGVKPDGTMWYYPNNMDTNTGGKPFVEKTQVGKDWQQFDKVIAADYSGDGHADIVAVKPDGTMYFLPEQHGLQPEPRALHHGRADRSGLADLQQDRLTMTGPRRR